MLTTIQMLDLAKARNNCTDYRLAKLLGVSPSSVTNYRAGRSHPDDTVVPRLSELAGLDACQVAVWLAQERARDDVSRELWRSIATRLGASTTAALSILVSITGGPDGGAMAQTPEREQALTVQSSNSDKLSSSVYYVNSLIRRFKRTMADFFDLSAPPKSATVWV